MDVTRRLFVKQGALSLLFLGLPPRGLARTLLAGSREATRPKSLVVLFLRGAVDGLDVIVPFGEPSYYRDRSSIALPRPSSSGGGLVDLDGFFGLHPALAPLEPLWRNREFGVVHAVGSPSATRSHFEAQDYMETATPDRPATRDGWLNRTLEVTNPTGSAAGAGSDQRPAGANPGARGRTLADPAAHEAAHEAGAASVLGAEALRAVALSADLPLSLRGRHPALAIPDLDHVGVLGGRNPWLESAFESLYRTRDGDEVGGAAREAFDAEAILRRADPAAYRARSGVEYPATPFGRSLRQVAQLLKADVGLEVAFADLGGWDTHVAQGAEDGRLGRLLDELGRGLRAFHDDLGDRMEDVAVLTVSEFGRTVAENGSGGTDHGHANCMLLMGGPVRGGVVHGRWPGLEPEQRYQGRDLAVTTDFRDVFAELADRLLGARDLERVLPGYRVDPARYPGVLG